MKKVRVLFLVNTNIPESYALELAQHIKSANIDLLIVSLYYIPKINRYIKDNTIVEIYSKGPFDLKGIFKLFRLIKEYNPDIIHCNHTISAFCSSIFGRLLKIPVIIFTVHNDHRSMKTYQNILNFFTSIFVDSIVCNSKNTKERLLLIEKIVAYKKAIVIYNGVDIQRIKNNCISSAEILKEHDFPKKTFLLVTVGRLVWVKDFITLINAMDIVVKKNDKIRLVIVGGGPLYNKLYKKIKQLGLDNHVKITGSLERDNVYKVINAADCFIISPIYEGFCMALVEAMIASKSVIHSNISVFDEIISNLGISVKSGNKKDIAEAILMIADKDMSFRNKMGALCYKRAEEMFSIKKTVENYYNHYVSLLNTKIKRKYYP